MIWRIAYLLTCWIIAAYAQYEWLAKAARKHARVAGNVLVKAPYLDFVLGRLACAVPIALSPSSSAVQRIESE